MKIGIVNGRKCWVPDDFVTPEPIKAELTEEKVEEPVKAEEPETKAKPKPANKAKTSSANKSKKAGSRK